MYTLLLAPLASDAQLLVFLDLIVTLESNQTIITLELDGNVSSFWSSATTRDRRLQCKRDRSILHSETHSESFYVPLKKLHHDLEEEVRSILKPRKSAYQSKSAVGLQRDKVEPSKQVVRSSDSTLTELDLSGNWEVDMDLP